MFVCAALARTVVSTGFVHDRAHAHLAQRMQRLCTLRRALQCVVLCFFMSCCAYARRVVLLHVV
eukprot:10501121-Alexandrium_andersonii.AAC.1